MKHDNKKLLMTEIIDETEKTYNLALEVRKDFLLAEASTAEYACYVALCLKRLNILKKVVENLDLTNDCAQLEEFNDLVEKLEPALLQMKKHAGTGIDTNAQITCNALLNSFKNRFGRYLTESELNEAITI